MRMWNTAIVDRETKNRALRSALCHLFLVTTAAMVMMLVFTSDSFGQSDSLRGVPESNANQSGFSQAFKSPFNAGQAQQEARDPWKFEARLHLQKGTSEGYLVLQMDLEKGHYIYSVSPKGSPAPTKVSVVANPSVQTRGVFAPNVPAEVTENDPVFNRRIEKHKGQVQFFIPCQLDGSVDFEAGAMPVIEFNGQVCSSDGVCIPITGHKIPAKFAGFFEREGQSAAAQPATSGGAQTLMDR